MIKPRYAPDITPLVFRIAYDPDRRAFALFDSAGAEVLKSGRPRLLSRTAFTLGATEVTHAYDLNLDPDK